MIRLMVSRFTCVAELIINYSGACIETGSSQQRWWLEMREDPGYILNGKLWDGLMD